MRDRHTDRHTDGSDQYIFRLSYASREMHVTTLKRLLRLGLGPDLLMSFVQLLVLFTSAKEDT